jgi:hypothetical protein
MDAGEIVYFFSQLIAGAFASFFAIVLWSKTRDSAWMIVVIAAIAVYVNTIYSILDFLGIVGDSFFSIGTFPFMSVFLPVLPPILFCIAFAIMIIRKTRKE